MARLGRNVPNRPSGGPHPAVLSRNKLAAAVGRTPPTYGTPAETVWDTIGTKSTTVGGTGSGSLTWVTGDIILVLGIGADTGVTLGTPTATGLTFTQQTSSTITNACTGYAWTATAASGGSSAIQVVPGRTNANDFWGIIAYVVHGSDGIGTKSAGADTAQTISTATTQDNSAVFEAIGDWGTGSVSGHTWTPSGQTEREASQNGTAYTVYAADWADRGTAGTVSYGVSVTASGQNYTKIAIEMLGTTATVSGGMGVQPFVPAYFCCPPWPAVPPVTITASQPLGNPAVGSPDPLVVSPPFTPVPIPPVSITASRPLGNPAVGTGSALVVTPRFVSAPIPGVLLFGPGAPAPAVVSAPTPQPLVVTPPFMPVLPAPARVFSPTTVATTPNAEVVSPPYVPVPIPGAQISSSQPLGNPAVGTSGPLVVSAPWVSKVPGALLFGPGAPTAAVVTGSTPNALVVTPPNLPVAIPVNYISASQPLGNPAVGTPGPLVVGPPFTPAPILAVRIFGNPAVPAVVTTFTPSPLVVTPPFTPVLIPETSITGSQPLGNPAVGTASPLVVGPPFMVVPVPGARISNTPVIPTIGTRALVVTSTFIAPVPGAKIFVPPPVPIVVSPFALGVQPMVVTPTFRWTQLTVAVLSNAGHFCVVTRPGTGTTTEPGTGTTVYDRAVTVESTTGTTARPNTGTTTDPC